jgi:hypothetical protein
MGIDGIDRPGPGLPAPPTGGIGEASGPAAADGFRVDPGTAADPVGPSDALERLGRGEITLDAYLDARVTEACANLEGKLPADELEFVQRELRAELATDPVLIELVRRATGSLASEPNR